MLVPKWPSVRSGVFKGALILTCAAVAVIDGIWLGEGKTIFFALLFGLAVALVLPNITGMKLLLCIELIFVIFERKMPPLARFCVLISALAGFSVGVFIRQCRTEYRRRQRATRRSNSSSRRDDVLS